MHTLTGNHSTLPNFAQDLATFMLLRGPYAFLGFHWSGCGVAYGLPEALLVDYGAPVELCRETAPNSSVFVRAWTKADVTMDCNTYTGASARCAHNGDPNCARNRDPNDPYTQPRAPYDPKPTGSVTLKADPLIEA